MNLLLQKNGEKQAEQILLHKFEQFETSKKTEGKTPSINLEQYGMLIQLYIFYVLCPKQQWISANKFLEASPLSKEQKEVINHC